ncbi:hypothetical protein V2J09_003158 [Rumex salicifolius]
MKNVLKLFSTHFHTIYLLLFFLLISCFQIQLSLAINQEAKALIQWKTSLHSQNQSFLSSWTLSTTTKQTPCHWLGVGCDTNGSVVRLNLTNVGLTGTLSSFNFSSLPNLAFLDLHDNNLFGNIPPLVSNLTKLKSLHLGYNQFTGNIPHELGNGRLKALKVLNLISNHISGPIPHVLGNISSLSSLILGNNRLVGEIPSQLGRLRNLLELRINLNNLTGPVPSSIGNLVHLNVLSIYGNQLSGTLPLEINKLTNLTLFYLSNNTISGSLPEKICQGGILRDFCASNNLFNGTIPKGLKNCKNLTRLRLDRNNLVGNISQDFGVYPIVDYLDLSYNNFYGEISPNWAKCKLMTSLKISGNRVTGNIPHELGQATNLHFLDLSSNHLIGNIPKELGSPKSLFNLTLSNNRLSGEIPQEIGSLPQLTYLDLADNNLNGIIPDSIGNCSKMIYLNLSRNGFIGAIPPKIGDLKSLQVGLDLSRNSISGEIPFQLGDLESLEILNLSHNNLSGEIPSTFDQLKSLQAIDVSYNQLTGPLPDNNAIENSTIQSFAHNKALCTKKDSNQEILGLPTCSIFNTGKRSRSTKALLVTIPVIVTSLVLCVVVGVCLCRSKNSINENNKMMMKARSNGIKSAKESSDQCNSCSRKNRLSGNLFSVWSYDGKLVYSDIIEATQEFDSSTGQVVAVKKLRSIQCSGKGFESEIQSLTRIRHRNIVKLYGFCSHAEHSLLVYEHVERGSLSKLLWDDDKVRELTWHRRINLVTGIANAVCYMHHDCTPAVIHRDISSNNVLVDRDFEARVSDFGTSRLLTLDSSNWTELAGTYGYIAPVRRGLMKVKSIVDQRLPTPSSEEAKEVATVIRVALSCIEPDPQRRPNMKSVAHLLMTRVVGLEDNALEDLTLEDLRRLEFVNRPWAYGVATARSISRRRFDSVAGARGSFEERYSSSVEIRES